MVMASKATNTSHTSPKLLVMHSNQPKGDPVNAFTPVGPTLNKRIPATEAEFIRAHVSRYSLPKKLNAAQKGGARNVSVPTMEAVRLLARVGEDAPERIIDQGPAPTNSPEGIPECLAGALDWDEEGCAIVTREQIEALISQAVAIGHATPKKPVRKATDKAVVDLVAQARREQKPTVSVPTGQLGRLLEIVDAQRAEVNSTATVKATL